MGKVIQSKLVELLGDVEKVTALHSQQDAGLILSQMRENIKDKKIYKLDFVKKGIEEINTTETFSIFENQLKQTELFFPYIKLDSIITDALKEKYCAIGFFQTPVIGKKDQSSMS